MWFWSFRSPKNQEAIRESTLCLETLESRFVLSAAPVTPEIPAEPEVVIEEVTEEASTHETPGAKGIQQVATNPGSVGDVGQGTTVTVEMVESLSPTMPATLDTLQSDFLGEGEDYEAILDQTLASQATLSGEAELLVEPPSKLDETVDLSTDLLLAPDLGGMQMMSSGNYEPEITNFMAIHRGGNTWYFYGEVLDENPDGLTITFSGLLSGHSTQVYDADTGAFEYTHTFALPPGGYVYADTVDEFGLPSNTAAVYLS